MNIKVLGIKKLESNGKSLKGFATIEIAGIIIRDLRIIQEGNKRPFIGCPQVSWKNPQTQEITHASIVTFPGPLKSEIDNLILRQWYRDTGAKNDESTS
jgi:DNA-binding cell septation regulator SpoVG